jgi:hypothetical protein
MSTEEERRRRTAEIANLMVRCLAILPSSTSAVPDRADRETEAQQLNERIKRLAAESAAEQSEERDSAGG